jgi:hypothetical protein
MIIAIISTLISSIALAGVAASLLLQARQLRVSQLQISHAAQFDLLKIGFDRPDIIAGVLEEEPDNFSGSIYINWTMKYMQLSYDINTLTAEAVRVQARTMFSAQFPRSWWLRAKPIYLAEATTKREVEFISVIDEVYEQALHSTKINGTDSEKRESPPPSPSS